MENQNKPPICSKPVITFPYNDEAYPRIEVYLDRTVTKFVEPEYGSACPQVPASPQPAELANCKLVGKQKVDDAGRYIRCTYDILPGPQLRGQDYDEQFGVLTGFYEQTTAAGAALGNAATAVVPGDAQQQKIKVTVPNSAQLDSLAFSLPGTMDIMLPDILTGINVIWEAGVGSGVSGEDGTGGATGLRGELSLSFSSTGSGSKTLIPDIQPIIKPVWGRDLPVTHWFLFMHMPFTASELLTKLSSAGFANATVHAWPRFYPQPHFFTLLGQRLSLECRATAQQHISFNTESSGLSVSRSQSTGYAKNGEVSSVVKTVPIPPTIHGAITLNGDISRSADVTVNARAHMVSGGSWNDVDSNQSATQSLSASVQSAELTGSILPATATNTAYPTTGLYLKDIPSAQPYKWGYALVHAVVFNFANL